MVRTAISIICALVAAAGCQASTVLYSSFDQDSVTPFPRVPSGWKMAISNSAAIYSAVEDDLPAGNRVVRLHDDNGPATSNNTLSTTFPAATSGVVTAQMDLYLKQTGAGFGTRLTSGGVATSGSSWATAALFEGNVSYAAGAGPGDIDYQTRTSPVYLLNPAGKKYQAGTWYTLRVVADLDSKLYKLFFGLRGGVLDEITPPGGVEFIRTNSNTQVSQIGGISFLTSNRNGDASGDLLIDNISVETNLTPASVTVSGAKLAPLGSLVRVHDAVVSATREDLGGPFFYIQDATGGIRVRGRGDVLLRQTDMVNVTGKLDRQSDNGFSTQWEGEKEIEATQIEVAETFAPVELKPIGVRNSDIGGDDFGPVEADGFPAVPGVFAAYGGPGYPPPFIRARGLNNVGMYGKFWGVVKLVETNPAEPYYPFIYIDDGTGALDGSNYPSQQAPQTGVRVLLNRDAAPSITPGEYVVVTGVSGAISASDLRPNQITNNVRIIRAVEEPFVDTNANGLWDPGESYTDTNNNGVYDGIIVQQNLG